MKQEQNSSSDRERELFRVDDLIIDVGLQSVSRGNIEIPLPNLSFKLLLVLVRSAPNFLSNEALMERVWPGLVVNSETVSKRVALLREALGDDSREPRYVAGLRSRGYRLIGPVAAGTQPETTPLPDSAAAPATGEHAQQQPRAPWWKARRTQMALTAIACILIAVVVISARIQFGQRRGNGALNATQTTIAVMPFDSISAEPGDAYLAVGIPEMLLNRISSVHELIVIARGSSFALAAKGLDPREIGRRLGSSYIVEGGVQRDGDRLRVAVEVIETASNKLVWSERFDRHMADILRVEDEMGDQVTAVLLGRTGGLEAKSLTKDRSSNIEAYLAFLRGRASLGRFTIADSDAAVRDLELSVQLDPQFASAYASLYDAKMQAAARRYQDLAPARVQYQPLIDHALQLDPNSGAAYFARAMWAADGSGSAKRDSDFARGAELDPSNGRGLTAYAEYLDIDRPQDATRVLQQAMRIDPISPRAHFFDAVRSLDTYGFRVVQQKMQEILELDPNFVPALQRYGKYQWQLHGELASAAQLEEHAIGLDPANPWTRHTAMAIYLDLGDVEAARAVAAGTPQSVSGTEVLLPLWDGDWRSAGLAAGEGQPGWQYGIVENWGASEALRDYALNTRQLEPAIGFLKAKFRLTDSPPYGLRLENFQQAVYLSQLAAAEGRAGQAADMRHAAAKWNDANEAQYGPLYARRLRASILLLDGKPDAALTELAESFRSGDYVHWWYTLKYDPLWTPLHNDPRFQTILADVNRYVAIQRSKLDSLREQGLVPQRTKTTPAS
jgi:TolB-like protein/DNA-binding winged helix-turn-helix (wHTH) protein/Tfp pilus assembly protein PilF